MDPRRIEHSYIELHYILHYTTHCINAIIIVINSPPREAHYPDLLPP